MRLPDAIEYAGGRSNLKTLLEYGLKPVIEHKSNTTFDRVLLDQAMDKFAQIQKCEEE